MADFSNIKQEINSVIYDNENGGITSKSLRELEINIVDSINEQKQDVISDLSEIRQNSSNAYQKPSTGIPETDLDSQVQQKLNTEGASISGNDELNFDEQGTINGDHDVVTSITSTIPWTLGEQNTGSNE